MHKVLQVLAPLLLAASASAEEMSRIRVAEDGGSFVVAETGGPFVPWGFNYDHDEEGRLLEDYWDDEWPKVVEDFQEMKRLGANVVRIHLQTGKFLKSPEAPNEHSLRQLARLLELAEETRLYLDLTGLGCYHKQDVPAWYDALGEEGRWNAQSRFWEAVADTCSDSAAVFCYDLMNEPVVPGRSRTTEWLGPAFAGKHFVQYITRELGDRERPAVAQAWVRKLVSAIRRRDEKTLVTVGLVPWSLDRPGLTSGFAPQRILDELDFIAVHIYPEKDKIDEAMETLKGFSLGKPVVIEETFPLKCSPEELSQFFEKSVDIADGWIGFYWGQTPEELRPASTIGEAITAGWLDLFQNGPPR
ncbi:MAG: cellulase family glycosylhydrolase [Planctomycetes bacterium]|nr:cellulase family glycosylhydrolase [Planctomycetota bacterium]